MFASTDFSQHKQNRQSFKKYKCGWKIFRTSLSRCTNAKPSAKPTVIPTAETPTKREFDYLEVYQDIVTPSAAIDVELFHLPGEGMFAVFANSDSGGDGGQGVSGLYRWVDKNFRPYQRLPSVSAQSWCHFTIDSNVSIWR